MKRAAPDLPKGKVAPRLTREELEGREPTNEEIRTASSVRPSTKWSDFKFSEADRSILLEQLTAEGASLGQAAKFINFIQDAENHWRLVRFALSPSIVLLGGTPGRAKKGKDKEPNSSSDDKKETPSLEKARKNRLLWIAREASLLIAEIQVAAQDLQRCRIDCGGRELAGR